MCVIKQFFSLFYDKNIMFEKKTITEKHWQNMLHDKTIPSQQNLGHWNI